MSPQILRPQNPLTNSGRRRPYPVLPTRVLADSANRCSRIRLSQSDSRRVHNHLSSARIRKNSMAVSGQQSRPYSINAIKNRCQILSLPSCLHHTSVLCLVIFHNHRQGHTHVTSFGGTQWCPVVTIQTLRSTVTTEEKQNKIKLKNSFVLNGKLDHTV